MTINPADLADRTSTIVQEGLRHYCGICHAAPAFDCWDTLNPGKPLPGRVIHIERATGVNG